MLSAVRPRAIFVITPVILLAALVAASPVGAGNSTGPNFGGGDDGNGGSHVDVSQTDGSSGRVPGYKGPVHARHLGVPQTDNTNSMNIDYVDCSSIGIPATSGLTVAYAKNSEAHVQLAAFTEATPAQVQTSPADPASTPGAYFGVCVTTNPSLGPPPGSAQARAQAVDFAKAYFNRIPLPRPQPEISAKNGGICGATHSLDLHMDPEYVYTEDSTPFGSLEMHVYARTDVYWGDGTHDIYTDGGAPWPGSDITHSWNTRGYYAINATAHWVADFTMGPYDGYTYRGVLSGLTTSGSIDSFRVWEAQAVLTA